MLEPTNSIHNSRETEWLYYRRPSFNVQVASGLLTTITLIALTTLFGLHPYLSNITANLPVFISLSSGACCSFIIFILSSCMNYYACRKQKFDQEDEQFIADLDDFKVQALRDLENPTEKPQKVLTQPSLANQEHVEKEQKLRKALLNELLENYKNSNRKDLENEKPTLETIINELSSLLHPVSTSPCNPIALKEDPVSYLKTVLIQPIFKATRLAVLTLLIGDCLKVKGDIVEAYKQLDDVFKNLEQLTNSQLDNPKLFVGEFLRYFGKGKKTKDAHLRRAIAAFNSGDPEIYKEIRKEYEGWSRGVQFGEVLHDLKHLGTAELMKQFPTLLEKHFCLSDEKLKSIGSEILRYIFNLTSSNQKVLDELNNLKQKALHVKHPFAIIADVEHFIRSVFDQANVEEQQLKDWNTQILTHVFTVQFRDGVCRALGTLAYNFEIFYQMITEKDNNAILILLDQTFLLAESNEAIKKTELQKSVYKLQSEINLKKKEEDRVAFLILDNSDSRSLETLKENEEIFMWCLKDPPSPKLNKAEHKKITEIETECGVRLIPVPIFIPNHPLKIFKEHESLIRFGSNAVKYLLPIVKRLILPKIHARLPKMSTEEIACFDHLFHETLTVFFSPIQHAVIHKTDLTPVFEKVVQAHGKQLANQMQALIADKDVDFEKISQTWTEELHAISRSFLKEIFNVEI